MSMKESPASTGFKDPVCGMQVREDSPHRHEHGGRWSTFRHRAADFFGGHSHDAGDQIDDVLEATASGRRALIASLGGLGATADHSEAHKQWWAAQLAGPRDHAG